MANKPEYQDISTLDTLTSVTETAWAPVVDKNKTGKKVDLSTLVPNSMQNFESVDELTTEQKAAFLGSAAVPACGTVETNGTKITKSIPVSELVPANIVVDANYVHTDNNFTDTLKTKLDGIAAGAEVNVQSDWNQTNTGADDYIKNKPTIPSSGYSRVTLNDLEPAGNKWNIPVHNRESVTVIPVNYTNQNTFKILVDDACDDAIVRVNVPSPAANSIYTIEVVRGNTSLTKIFPIVEVYEDANNVLISTNYGASGELKLPTDWSEVDISSQLPRYYDDGGHRYKMLYHPSDIKNGINVLVVRIVADVAYVNYVPLVV